MSSLARLYLAARLLKADAAGYMFCFCFLFSYCQTGCLKIYRTDPRQVLKVVTALVVDDQSKVSFLVPVFVVSK